MAGRTLARPDPWEPLVWARAPSPGETQYDLYLGLAPGESMTQADLTQRLNECTGVGLPPGQRTEEQRRNLANILGVTRIPEGGLSGQLSDATFHLREISQVELGGRNALPNADVVYSGSDDDEALNLSVQRYQSAEEAVASLSADADPTEVVSIPIMGMHAPAGSIPITLPRRTSPEFLRDSPEISALRCTLVSALRDPPRPAGGSWHL